MGKRAGEISVKLTVEGATAAADWISSVCLARPVRRGLLGSERAAREDRRRLADLADKLRQIARRKALKRGVFLRPLPRVAVLALLHATGFRQSLILGSRPPAYALKGDFLTQLEFMATALKAPGRPQDSPEDRQKKIAKNVTDESNRRKMSARERSHQGWVEFVRSGGSLLGSKIPLPEK